MDSYGSCCISTSTTYTHIRTARLIDPSFLAFGKQSIPNNHKILTHSETITVLPNVPSFCVKAELFRLQQG